jgi:hypothetical protein
MLVGKLITAIDFAPMELLLSDRSNLTLHICNSLVDDNYLAVKYVAKDGMSVMLFGDKMPIRGYDSLTADFKITLRNGDEIQAKSDAPGISLSLLK